MCSRHPLELSRQLHPSETGGDQQFPLERAFAAPYVLTQRLGRPLDVEELASFDPEALGAIFATPSALHRFPGSMAKRVQALCQVLVEKYDRDLTKVWSTAADGKELLKRIGALPGFGVQKAKIFVALLGKQLDVTPPGWRGVTAPYGDEDSVRSVADITGPDSLLKVRDYKKQMKAAAKASAG
nr:HhH-GPD-type base excision DNA repair protein [Frankia umida]